MDMEKELRDVVIYRYNQLRDIKWLLFIGFFIGIFFLGMWGFSLAFQSGSEQKTLTDLAYYSLQLFKTQSGAIVPINNWQLEWARFLAPILAVTAVLMVLLIFIDYLKKFKLRFLTKQHVIICGMGYLGPKIADYFFQQKTSVVIIEKEEKNPELDFYRQKGAVVYIGDATKQNLLEKAQIHKARHIFAVTGKDALNAEIAIKCNEMTKKTLEKRLTCHVHIVDSYLCNLLRNQIRSRASTPKKDDLFMWEFFNIYQIAGYCIQKKYPLFPEDDSSIPDVNVLIVGVGRMGKTLISRSARKWKDLYGKSGKTITFSVLDHDADEEIRLLCLQYSSLKNYCNFQCVNLDLTSADFLDGKYLNKLQTEKKISKIYICIDDSSIALTTALTLHRQMHNQDLPIIVRTTDINGFATILNTLKASCEGLSNIFTFPIVSCDCCKDFIVMDKRDILGKQIHANYVAQKIQSGADPEKDLALKPWSELLEIFKESNRLQGDDYLNKVQKINCFISLVPDWNEELFEFTRDEIELLAEDEHNRWMKERLDDGWTYGKERDPEKKISPYLKSWADLTEEEKELDRGPIRNMPEILSKIDMRISRFPGVCKR